MMIKDKLLKVPIIQGGMGVGVSLSSLAGNVAKCGAMGVISSVNAGYREADFFQNPKEANLRALKAEIQKAKEIAQGNGLVAVNIMTAVSHYEETCKCAVEAGADAIISGAGLPLQLPEFTKGTNTLCAPIVSSARAAVILCKHYQRHYGVLPDFLVIEGCEAGGHLGFAREELLEGTAKENPQILEEVLAVAGDLPVFVAGGVFDGKDMALYCSKGAAGVQIATRFIATQECDADEAFKKVIVDAKKEDALIIQSPVGMPARAINSPLIKKLQSGERFPALKCNNCLKGCKKNEEIPYCISRALIAAVQGNVEEGLFFTGGNVGRIHEITTVSKLIAQIMEEYEETLQ